jgi:hypothetical protein
LFCGATSPTHPSSFRLRRRPVALLMTGWMWPCTRPRMPWPGGPEARSSLQVLRRPVAWWLVPRQEARWPLGRMAGPVAGWPVARGRSPEAGGPWPGLLWPVVRRPVEPPVGPARWPAQWPGGSCQVARPGGLTRWGGQVDSPGGRRSGARWRGQADSPGGRRSGTWWLVSLR